MSLTGSDSLVMFDTRLVVAGRRDWVRYCPSAMQSDNASAVDEHQVRTECSSSAACEHINHEFLLYCVLSAQLLPCPLSPVQESAHTVSVPLSPCTQGGKHRLARRAPTPQRQSAPTNWSKPRQRSRRTATRPTFRCSRNLPSGPIPTSSFVVDAAITQQDQDRGGWLLANTEASQVPCQRVYFCFCLSSLLFSWQTINQTATLYRSLPPLLNQRSIKVC
jgi:hypothetical protein